MAIVLTGCGGEPSVDGPSVIVRDVRAETGGLLVRTDPNYQADGAEFIGQLSVVDGCVFLSSGTPQQKRRPVIWPYGTVWQTHPEGLLVWGERLVTVGDELKMSGGIGQRLQNEGLPQEVIDVLDFCGDPGELSIVSLG